MSGPSAPVRRRLAAGSGWRVAVCLLLGEMVDEPVH